MEPFTEVILNLEQGKSKYYLTHKGREREISAKYQKEIDRRRQTEVFAAIEINWKSRWRCSQHCVEWKSHGQWETR